MRSLAVALGLLLATASAAATEHPNWTAYQKANRYKCPGPFDTIAKTQTLTLAGKKYRHTGYKLEVLSRDDDQNVKIGVLSAIKDVSPGTKNNFKAAIEWFKTEKVEWIVANGDLALEEFDLEEVIDMLGETGMPVLVVLGNSESKGSWARAYRHRVSKFPNLVNGTWIRQIIADDVEYWTMPGYHDKAFVHQGAGCLYKEENIRETLKNLKPEGTAPVVLVSHGPPRGTGKKALDYILDKKNVGDSGLNKLIDKAAIPFGLFGHILEAGGTAVGADMKSTVGQGKLVDSLHLNAGSLSGDPWPMNGNWTSYGMATIFSIAGKAAKYEVRKFKATMLE